MAAAGIREAKDIDLLVSEEVYERLKNSGWQKISKGPEDEPITYDVFEAHTKWGFNSSYSPTLEYLLATSTEVEGIPFGSLLEVRKWKVASGREKDIADIKLIDLYLEKN